MKSETLKSLKRDLVDPVKSFVEEVHEDTVGDAVKFYSGQARKVGKSVETAREKARIRREAIRREQEELSRKRKARLKKALIVIAAIAVLSLLYISVALTMRV